MRWQLLCRELSALTRRAACRDFTQCGEPPFSKTKVAPMRCGISVATPVDWYKRLIKKFDELRYKAAWLRGGYAFFLHGNHVAAHHASGRTCSWGAALAVEHVDGGYRHRPQHAETLRKAFNFETAALGHSRQHTVSIGVAATGAVQTSLRALMERADQTLYQAKRDGRNRVESVVAA